MQGPRPAIAQGIWQDNRARGHGRKTGPDLILIGFKSGDPADSLPRQRIIPRGMLGHGADIQNLDPLRHRRLQNRREQEWRFFCLVFTHPNKCFRQVISHPQRAFRSRSYRITPARKCLLLPLLRPPHPAPTEPACHETPDHVEGLASPDQRTAAC